MECSIIHPTLSLSMKHLVMVSAKKLLISPYLLHGPSMFAAKAKFMECSVTHPALSLSMKHLVTGQRQTAPNFSVFHWSPHGGAGRVIAGFHCNASDM